MKSIRRHLVLSLIVGTTALLLLTSLALYLYSRAFLIAEFDAALRSKALALVTLTEEQSGTVELNFADEFMPEFQRGERPEYFQVWLADGSTLERSRSLRGVDLPHRSGTVIHPAFWDLALPDGRSGRAVGIGFAPQRAERSAPKEALGGDSGAVVVLARERNSLSHTLAVCRAGLLLFCLVLLAAMAALVTIVVRRGLAPLGLVAERAAGINASSLESRFPAEGLPEELQPICLRLNDLLARLEEAFQRERRISADIAHEVGTPIAELRALIEVGMKWPEDAAGTAVTFGHVLAVVQKMETMVAGLLALARSEEGKVTIRKQAIAVSEAVEEIWLPLRAPAQRKGLAFAMDIAPGCRLQNDRALLRHILSNLLHNAVDYTPAGGKVRVQATTHNARFTLTVENTTTDLTADDLPRLFERFWRKNEARTSSQHSGLGLTLARSIAELMGLGLTAEMPTAGVLRLALRGPVMAHLNTCQKFKT